MGDRDLDKDLKIGSKNPAPITDAGRVGQKAEFFCVPEKCKLEQWIWALTQSNQ
jgi:hypothetical protein